jgi:Tfp pilus assembly protein PilF
LLIILRKQITTYRSRGLSKANYKSHTNLDMSILSKREKNLIASIFLVLAVVISSCNSSDTPLRTLTVITATDSSPTQRLNADDAQSYFERGVIYHKEGNLEQAIADFSKAIELDPNDVDAHIYRGDAYQKSGSLEQALTNFEYYLKLAPNGSYREAALHAVQELKSTIP